MIVWKNGLLVAIGGGGGALIRYGMNEIIPHAGIPFATLLTNVIGAFVLAFLSFSLFRNNRYPQMKLFIGTGLCGGFTTMSTYALETVKLIHTEPAAAFIYSMLTLFFAVGMAFAGSAAATIWNKRRGVFK